MELIFLLIMLAFTAFFYIPQLFLGDPKNYRMALRHGMVGGLIFTGTDHFINGLSRYVPIVPEFLSDYAIEIVFFTGFAQLIGAVGLFIPPGLYSVLGLPNLRKWTGIWLSVMFALLGIANVNVLLNDITVQGLEFGPRLYWLHPFFQPIFMLWALFVSGVIWKRKAKTSPS